MIYLELFLSFLKVGFFSIGGGYAAMPLIESLVVSEHGWLTVNEFSNLVTIAEMTPGPILVNGATFVGAKVAGFPGTVIATFASVFPSLIIVSFLAFLYYKYKSLSAMQSILKSIRPAVVALIASAGLTILINAVFSSGMISLKNADYAAAVLFAASFFAIRKLKTNPVLTMLICGVLYMAINLIIS